MIFKLLSIYYFGQLGTFVKTLLIIYGMMWRFDTCYQLQRYESPSVMGEMLWIANYDEWIDMFKMMKWVITKVWYYLWRYICINYYQWGIIEM